MTGERNCNRGVGAETETRREGFAGRESVVPHPATKVLVVGPAEENSWPGTHLRGVIYVYTYIGLGFRV